MIETSQFQTLVAVANACSFSKAAEDLGVTQSAISQSIKSLEQKIEVKLFKRSGKKVVLTTEGEKLYFLASDFLMRIENTLDEIRYDKEEMSGKVRVGTLIGIGKSWLAPALLKFAKDYPDLTVAIKLGMHDALISDFRNNKLDMLVLPDYFLPPFGEKILIGEEKATLVYPKSDRFKLRADIGLEELAKLPTVVFEHNAPLYLKWCKKRYKRIPKRVNIKYVINSHGSMLQAVAQGMGVAVIPTHVLKRSFYREQVRYSHQSFDVLLGKFYLLYNKDSEELLRIRTILDILKGFDNPLF